LFFINTDKIEKQLLANSEVESVKIIKKWPNKLIINLEIFEAVLQIKKDNKKYFINKDGKQINYYEANSNIPLLHLSQETNFSDLNPKINIDFINSINFINEYDLNKKMKMNDWNYVYNKNTGISVHINERQRIILGNSDQLEFKLNNLQKVFSTIMLEKIDFKEIDLRYNSKIVLR
jgi:cell division septal protein FtsQ